MPSDEPVYRIHAEIDVTVPADEVEGRTEEGMVEEITEALERLIKNEPEVTTEAEYVE